MHGVLRIVIVCCGGAGMTGLNCCNVLTDQWPVIFVYAAEHTLLCHEFNLSSPLTMSDIPPQQQQPGLGKTEPSAACMVEAVAALDAWARRYDADA
jgi:hypothetical protein